MSLLVTKGSDMRNDVTEHDDAAANLVIGTVVALPYRDVAKVVAAVKRIPRRVIGGIVATAVNVVGVDVVTALQIQVQAPATPRTLLLLRLIAAIPIRSVAYIPSRDVLSSAT